MGRDFNTQLKELGLTWMAENVDSALAKAKEGKATHADMLATLLDGERAARLERAVGRRLRAAKIPLKKSLADFRWTWPSKIDQDMVKDIFRLGFLKDNGNVVFMGGVGLGKTHLASALAAEACQRNIPTLFTKAIEIVDDLRAAPRGDALRRRSKSTRRRACYAATSSEIGRAHV